MLRQVSGNVSYAVAFHEVQCLLSQALMDSRLEKQNFLVIMFLQNLIGLICYCTGGASTHYSSVCCFEYRASVRLIFL